MVELLQSKETFIPPRLDVPALWAIDAILPVLCKTALNIESIEIDPEDIKALRHLRQGRLLYMSNHPSTVEPPVAFAVASRLGTRFHFMASRVVFNWYAGLLGQIIRRVGAFSVLPGAGDRDSIRTARSILAAPDGKLAIYPEGMMSGENDNLINFMPGAIQLGFWGLEDARKKDPSARLPVLCAFVKYIANGKPETLDREITESIGRLEKKLRIDPGEKNLLRRFLTVGRVLLENAERDYRIPPGAEHDYEYRVGRARHAALDAAARALDLELPLRADALSKIRELFAAVEAVETGFGGSLKYKPNPAGLQAAKRHIDRAYTFLILRPAYLLERPTAERFIEWLLRFETVVFGEAQLRPRKARVLFARPFYLDDYLNDYQTDRKAGLEKALGRVRSELEALLARGIEMTAPLVKPQDAGSDFKISPPPVP
ncbi:MAG: 1-acyl-sn-glycerol-3-phosphate acyltransferase [Spirochaetales bacterium]|nr:1-acyl-sn-glycerol-3-phosphate acyltransferase [Spirochaetales bacterium]